MGHTNYWTVRREFTDTEWQKLRVGALHIMDQALASGIALADSDGQGAPQVGSREVCFNGSGDQSFETFCLTRTPGRDFCKTGGIITPVQPYDGVVVSVLRMAKQVAPDAISISSDGGQEAFDNAPFAADFVVE